MSQTLPVFTGTTELVYNARYASIKSLFSNFAGADATKGINKSFDSFDVTTTAGVSSGDYQYIISGKGYPTRPISTTNNKCGSLMELKMAINGGLHSLQAQNMSINPLEFTYSTAGPTTVAAPSKFWLGVNCEKFSTANVLLSGVSTQNSAISLRINCGTASSQIINATMIILFDAIIEIDLQMRQASVKQ